MQGKHTSNLKNHLAVKHTTEYKIVIDLNHANPNNKKKNSKENCTTIDNLKKICMQLVTVHGRPLKMMEDAAFQQLLNMAATSTADVKQINIKSIKAMVTEQAYNIKQKIWNEIKNKLISLKLDSATCVERKFVGINIQYIKDAQIVVRNIAVRELHQSQTAEYLKENLEEILAEFNITNQDVYCTCTDNGANMIKMVKLIGGKYYIEDEVGESEETDESDDECTHSGAALNSGADEITQEEGVGSSEDEIFYTDIENLLPCTDFHIRGMLCAAHTLQLAVKDAIRKDEETNTILNQSRKIVNILRRPNNTYTLKAAKMRKPVNDCPTRWTSTYNMLKRLITCRDVCGTISEVSSIISSQFWSSLINLVACLDPVNAATVKLERQDLTIGDFYIIWLNCKNQLQEIDHSFAKNLIDAMQEREKKLLKNDVVLEALYLDRRLNVMLNDQQCEKAKTLLKETYHQLTKIKNHQTNEAEENSIGEEQSINDIISAPSTSRGLPALEEMLLRAERSRGSIRQTRSFDACLNELMSSPRVPLNENIIKVWNNSAIASSDLAMVANTVLAAPATQVSVERLFSSLKYILNPLRSNLNQYFLRDLMLIRENKDLID